MPLQAINLRQPYSCTLSTLGPAKEAWGSDICEWITQYWSKKALSQPGFPRLKFETSNEGYPHFHLALMFTDRQKYATFTKDLQKYMLKYKDDKPSGYAKEKQFSFRMFAVPTSETHNAKVLRGAALITHYLENPTKEKSTEGGNFVMEIEGFNAMQHIADLQAEADRYKAIIAAGTMFPEIERETMQMYQEFAEKSKAYLQRYQKCKQPLPPLTKDILANRPNIPDLAARFAKIVPKPPA